MTPVQAIGEKSVVASTASWLIATAVLIVGEAVVMRKITETQKPNIIIAVTTAILNTTLWCSNVLLTSALIDHCNLIRKTRRN